MKRKLSMLLVMILSIGMLGFPIPAKAADAFNLNGDNVISLGAKEKKTISFVTTKAGKITFSASVADKSDIWITLAGPKGETVMNDSGKWEKNIITDMYDLNISSKVYEDTYTVILENTADAKVEYTLKSSFVEATAIPDGGSVPFSVEKSDFELYRIEATTNGYFTVTIPNGDPAKYDVRLMTTKGEELDSDTTGEDWFANKNTADQNMKYKTVSVNKGVYYLKLENGSDEVYRSSIGCAFCIPSQKIKLNKSKVTLLLKKKKKKTFQIKSTLTPVTSTDALTYKSSNKKIAAVSNKGKITAKKVGKATITVTTTSGKKAKIKVTVKKK